MTRTAPDLDGFFDLAIRVFERAATGQGGAVARDFAVAGQGVRVQFAGAALAERLGGAMAHIEAPANTRELTIYAWGGEMLGGLLPPPSWEAIDHFERGNVRGHQGERHMLVYDRRIEVFSALDHARGMGLYWLRDAAHLNYRERGTPMRRVLQAWAQRRGMFIAHAAAVGRPEGGVLIAGRTGSGKSTTALACLRSDLGYAGDDCVLVAAEPEPYLHGLYHSAKLNPAMLDWLPEAQPLVVNRAQLGEEKALLYLWPAWAQKISTGFPLRAIVVPHPTRNTQSIAQPMPAEAIYKAIVPDMLFTALGDARRAAEVMGRLIRALPCYELALGTDLATVPAAIDELMGERVR